MLFVRRKKKRERVGATDHKTAPVYGRGEVIVAVNGMRGK
jgi:hypothetical protein